MKELKVKGYAIVQNNNVMDCFSHNHSVFMKRIYTTEEGARNVARKLPSQLNVEVAPCTITIKMTDHE